MSEPAETTTAADTPRFRYTAALAGDIERRWQDFWETEGTFDAPNPVGELADASHPRAGAPKLHVQDMFPYPSGSGLHVGHPLGYIGTDSYTRYKRMTGFNVLHPMGFDAFGLPAEQYAVQTGTHPRVTTERTSSVTARSCAAWAWPTTTAARSRPRTRTTTAGPSGSSCRSSTRGTTRSSARPGRSTS